MRRPLPFSMRLVVAITAAISLSIAPARASAQIPTNVFFFGDSFTDTGNAHVLGPANGFGDPTPFPPYFNGRFSNGPNWADQFAAKVSLSTASLPAIVPPKTGNNYAIGGATTGLTGTGGSASGMQSQVAQFTTDHSGGVAPGALFVLWGGGNDILDAVTLASPVAQLQAVNTAVTNLIGMTSFLHSTFGANNFLIPLLPDAGASPFFIGNPTGTATATSLTKTFNQYLAQGVLGLDFVTPGLNALTLHLDYLLTNVQADAALGGPAYGITNTVLPCFSPVPGTPSCTTSLFVDALHPTTKMDALIADAAYNRVVFGRDVSVVPEPSTVALLAVGLAVTAVAARRRRVA